MSELDKAYAAVTRRQTARSATVVGAWGWIVVILCFVLGGYISTPRIPGLVIDALITVGVLAFMLYGLRDSYRLLREVDRQ